MVKFETVEQATAALDLNSSAIHAETMPEPPGFLAALISQSPTTGMAKGRVLCLMLACGVLCRHHDRRIASRGGNSICKYTSLVQVLVVWFHPTP